MASTYESVILSYALLGFASATSNPSEAERAQASKAFDSALATYETLAEGLDAYTLHKSYEYARIETKSRLASTKTQTEKMKQAYADGEIEEYARLGEELYADENDDKYEILKPITNLYTAEDAPLAHPCSYAATKFLEMNEAISSL